MNSCHRYIIVLLGATLTASCTSPESSVNAAHPTVSKAVAPGMQHRASMMTVYRPANSTFYVRNGDAGKAASELRFGAPGDVPLWADIDGTGVPVPALYRHGQWLISTHADGKADETVYFGGEATDIPLTADVDGDGKADLVIFRNGEWIVRGSRDPSKLLDFHFGQAGDIPMLADFDGDGKIDLVVFRQGQWFIDTARNGMAQTTLSLGGATDRFPIPAIHAGAHGASPALFRDGMWIIGTAGNSPPIEIAFGGSGDIPVFLEMKD